MSKAPKKKVILKKKSPKLLKKKVIAPKVEVKSSVVEEIIQPVNEEHQCTEECVVEPSRLTENLSRMSSLNSKVEYVLSFKPEIQRLPSGQAIVLIGASIESGLKTSGPTVHSAMIRMFELLTE